MSVDRTEALRQRLRQHAKQIYSHAIDAVLPDRAIRRFVQRQGHLLYVADAIYDLRTGKTYLVAFGKAAVPMASALAAILGPYLSEGVAITKYGHAAGGGVERVRVFEAGHPVPDEAGLAATRRALDLVSRAQEEDLVLVAVSGGGSALLVQPDGEVTLQDKQKTTDLLLRCGATIQEINTVRKHLSAVKGGRLARAIWPAQSCSLILSDIIGDPLEFIASGPTVPDSTTFGDALAIVDRYGLRQQLPEAVRRHLERGASGNLPETPKPGEAIFARARHVLVGSNHQAVEAARDCAESLGYHPLILTTALQGEAREVAQLYPALAYEILKHNRPVPSPACILAGGEPTVTVRGSGKGGRNQELALAALTGLSGKQVSVLAAVGTDGTDGPTDAAGAIVDDASLTRAQEAGLDWRTYLKNNDAYTFFATLGDLIKTGPTQTNVMDVHILLVEAC